MGSRKQPTPPPPGAIKPPPPPAPPAKRWGAREAEARRTLDRELLREAGEHLGMLAEQARERWELTYPRTHASAAAFDRYARLSRLGRELLEIANG